MKKILIIFALLTLTVISTPAQSTKDAAAIRKVLDDQVVAWNRFDVDAFMLGYWNSDKLKFVSGDTITFGWQKTLDNYKKRYSTKALMGQLSFSELDISILSKDAAVVLGSWSLAREKDNPHGKFTLIFRKFKEGWRIVMDHTS